MNSLIDVMTTRLQEAFHPEELRINDESEQHRGHPGSQSGGGHFAIVIKSHSLQHLSRIDGHRKIYEIFQDFFPHTIHALKIQILR